MCVCMCALHVRCMLTSKKYDTHTKIATIIQKFRYMIKLIVALDERTFTALLCHIIVMLLD